ncbi:cytochrome bd-I oxidase subunit CydX [Telluria beijingensis]|uniref:cytochrome bd-I oxidase subunit CydX n=1 Tax=Telluria beijingensis TaxID=3068633 RepID=UPI0027957638|nr:cytochrome bd-I oxidase subunit CydX [Massilia sp. REN29]
MWYFAWLLGLPLAAAFGVLNAMWYELMDDAAAAAAAKQKHPAAPPAPDALERRRA